jgi:hypothetical protein
MDALLPAGPHVWLRSEKVLMPTTSEKLQRPPRWLSVLVRPADEPGGRLPTASDSRPNRASMLPHLPGDARRTTASSSIGASWVIDRG